MADDTTPAPADATDTAATGEERTPDTPTPSADTDNTDWKALARKWESRAKANADAATRLAEIEDANKTAAEKAADAQAAAEYRAVEAEAKATRLQVALEHKLSKDDAALLDGITDEEVMRAIASRLATPAPAPTTGPRAPLEGGTPNNRPANEDLRSFVDGLVARA